MDDITFQMDDGKFNFRVAAVIINNSKLLVMTDNGLPYFYLPGGRVKFQESTEAAVRREILEELAENVASLDLLWVVENFFHEKQSNIDFHEICLFYECSLHENSSVYNMDIFTTRENGRENTFKWVLIEELDNLEVLPKFLKTKLLDGRKEVQHFTFDQDATWNGGLLPKK